MTPAQLKARMTALGMSQGKIAEALGVSRETVVRWSTGKLPMPAWVPYALGMVSFAPDEPVITTKAVEKAAKLVDIRVERKASHPATEVAVLDAPTFTKEKIGKRIVYRFGQPFEVD